VSPEPLLLSPFCRLEPRADDEPELGDDAGALVWENDDVALAGAATVAAPVGLEEPDAVEPELELAGAEAGLEPVYE
jgi:hypothetical protein